MAEVDTAGGNSGARLQRPRPLSPHLQVYRWTVLMAMSILHRVTGVALAGGALLLAYWLAATASGPEAYETAQGVIASWVGRTVLFGFSAALIYHLLNGIRHLFWDVGVGFSVPASRVSGWLVLGLTAALTLAAWAAGYAVLGGRL